MGKTVKSNKSNREREGASFPQIFFTALAMETVYFKGEASPCGRAKVPAYPLCGAKAGGFAAPQRPRIELLRSS
ncbi:MAG: hypothetical protein LBU16_03565 [Treponema sp.]|jgi:hypothetical protein|nr:hypothetical protein [Treponema sp.]